MRVGLRSMLAARRALARADRAAPASWGELDQIKTIWSQTYSGDGRERVGSSFQSYAQSGYNGNAIVFAVIGKRLSVFSEVQFAWQNKRTGELFGTEQLRLLEEPWPNADSGELLARMEQDASLAGNAFVRIIEGRMLERLRPDQVTIISEQYTDSRGRPFKMPVAYYYQPDLNQDGYVFDVDEVVHWSPVPDPLAEFRGMSWLTPVVREINSDQGMTQYKLQYLEHAATPNMIIRYEQAISNDVRDRLQSQMQARYGGVDNAYRTMVLDAGADLTLVGNSLEQMSFATVQSAGENRIAAASGVPAIVAGLKEGLMNATYSNFEQAMRAFADTLMRPNWRSVCSALGKAVQAPPGARLWYDASQVAALRQGEKEQSETFHTLADSMALLLRVGFDADSVTNAAKAGDPAQLTHTGNLPVTLYPEGKNPSQTPSGSGNDAQEEEGT